MKLVLITSSPGLALCAQGAGVGRIMVDIERMGKFERQRFKDTWISKHELSDIRPVADVLTLSDLMVRINPLFEESKSEVDTAIASGADLIMLPMFKTIEEIDAMADLIGGRCGFVPLVETAEALTIVEQVASHAAVTETFIGLNDLHLSLKLDFMFEPLANGLLDEVCHRLAKIGKPYGFGGIARVGEGDLPAELIIRRHAHLGSTRVNLSRTFARPATSDRAGDLTSCLMQQEVAKLLREYERARSDGAAALDETLKLVRRQVDAVLTNIREAH